MLKIFEVREDVKVKFPQAGLFKKKKYIEKDVQIFYYTVAETEEEAFKKIDGIEFLNRLFNAVYFSMEASIYLESSDIQILGKEQFAREANLTINEIMKELKYKDACLLFKEQGLNINI